MANAFSVNERVPTTNALYAVWRLTRVLISAGWTVVRSSNGTSFGATDYWTTYAGLGTSSWIVLQGPGGRQICLWRGTTSVDTGKVMYAAWGGFTFGGSYGAADPGTLPSTIAYVRGSTGTFNTWLGGQSSTNPIRYLHVCAKDVSDGSFWMIGTTPGIGLNYAAHTLGFFSLTTANAADTDPYVFYSPVSSPTTDSIPTSLPDSRYNEGMLYQNHGYWRGWGSNTTWQFFMPQYNVVLCATGVRQPYTKGSPFAAIPVVLVRSVAGSTEMKGVVSHMRAIGYNDTRGTIYHQTGSGAAWALVGSASNPSSDGGALMFWDGTTPMMAYEI